MGIIVGNLAGGGMSPPNPHQIYVPVYADGCLIRDNGNDVIATCSSPVVAAGIAAAINRDATTQGNLP